MASDRNGYKARSLAPAAGDRTLLALAGIPLLVALLEWLFAPAGLPLGWPGALSLLAPLLVAIGVVFRVDRRPWTLMAWALGFAVLALLWLVWPIGVAAVGRNPAPWLAALATAIGVGASADGTKMLVNLLARSFGGFLVALCGLSLFAIMSGSPPGSVALGLGPLLAYLGVGAWLMARDFAPDAPRVMRLCTALLAGVALLVLVGWVLHMPYITQGGTDQIAMQVRSALSALLIASALRLLAAGRRNLALLPLAPVVVLCLTALLEEYAATAMGAGERLVGDAAIAEGVTSGQMAPSTAIAYLVACLGIALAPAGAQASRARWSGTWACGFVSVAIALIVLSGYLLQVPVLRSWGAFTPMSLMTAFTLLLIGLALGAGGSGYRQALLQRTGWMPLVVAGATIAASLFLWIQINRDHDANREALLYRQSELVEQALQGGIQGRSDALRRMGQRMVNARGEASRRAAFDLDAEIYLKDFPALVSLIWADPDTRVQRQLKRPGRGQVWVGRKLDFDPTRRDLFERARHSEAVVESPPLALVDGGIGELMAMPLRGDGQLNGFLIAVVKYDWLLPRVLDSTAPGHALRLEHDGSVLYARGTPPPREEPLRRDIDGAGSTLQLSIWPETSTHSPLANLLLLTGLATGGLVALSLRLAGLASERAVIAESRGRDLQAQMAAADAARAALQEAEQELSTVFESISDAFYTLDREWRFVFVNPRAEQLMRRDREQLVGHTLWEAFPEARGTVIEKEFRAAVSEGRAGEFEVHFASLGTWFFARCYPHPQGLAVYFQDISDRKRAEDEARQARAASERAQRMARLGSWEVVLDSGELRLSPEAESIFGLAPGQAIHSFSELVKHVHFEDRERLQKARRRLQSGEEPDLEVEYRVLRPDGEIRNVRELGTLLRDASGHAVAASGAIQDTTESQRTENALRELSRRLEQSLVMNRLVLENSLDVICVLDANGRFTQVSNASERVWGFSPAELVGRAYFTLAHPDDRAHTLREGAAVLAGHPTVDFRNRVVHKDGRVVSMQWSAVWSARDRMMFAVARDVTEASRQAEALREVRASLERAQQIARMGAWELDIPNNVLTWSDEVYRIFQVGEQEFAGTFEAFAARVHPDDLPGLNAAQARVLAGDGDLDVEHRIVLPGGRIGYVQERARLFRDEQGKPWKLAGSVQDITERKLSKLALEQERGFLKAVLESLSEGVVACDEDGKLTLFNHATRQLLGLPPEASPVDDLTSRYGLYEPDGVTPVPKGKTPLDRALEGKQVRDAEIVIAPQGLPPRTVVCSGRQIRSQDGRLLGAVVAMHDVTQRKRAQALEDGQRRILAGIAARRPLGESLLAIVGLAERQIPAAISSVLLLDDTGEHVCVGAAPNLPAEFNAAIHGLPIGPKAGSCGTAAYRGERVIVSDIDTDPLWTDYLPLVQRHGLKACWSTPVKAPDGRVVATFATYYREVREPGQQDLELVDGLAALCAVAIEHDAAFQSITASQQRFRSLFDEHPDLVYSLDLEGRYTEINERFQRVSGRPSADILGKHFDEQVVDSEREVVRAHFTAATQGEARTYEMTGIDADGRRVELRVTNLPIIVDGRVTGVFGIAQDISLLRKHQRDLSDALDAAEALSQQLHRLSEASIAVNRDLDENTLYQKLVDRVREIIGAHQAVVSVEVTGDESAHLLNAVSMSDKYARWRNYDVPIDGSGIYALVGEHQRSMRMSQAELEAHPQWRNFGAESGRHPPMRGWLAVPMIGSDGRTLGILQLSDKYRGEFSEDDEQVALQFSQMAVIAIERARLLSRLQVRDRFFEMSLEVFVVYNPASGRWVQVNQMLSDITGYSREELLARPIIEFIHPEDAAATQDRSRQLGEGRPVSTSFINRYLHRDGGVRWMEWMSTPAPDGLVYAVGRDVTQRLQAEATLRQTLADLNARNRELQDFAFIASHDLQEPLRKIRAFSDRLQQRHADSLAPEARDYLDRSSQAANRMQVLINDLLAYSRVAARSKPFTQVNLDTVLAGVVDDLEASLETSGGRVEAAPLPTLEADATQMRQLFQNLLSNALKFRSPERPPLIQVEAEREEGIGGPVWILRVRDNGMGFEPRHAEKVFAPFQRLHGRQEYEGTGIGLAIVRRIVERHRGSIQAEARPGEGATFIIRLPGHQPAEQAGLAIPLSEP